MRFFERVWFAGGREWVCSRASGAVLEVAVGTGLNLSRYPAGVRVTGVDLSPKMLELASARGRSTNLAVADASALPFAPSSFDAVVCTLSMCTIPDPRAAIAEMHRVLRPGGSLLLLDHVGSRWWPVWGLQRIVELFTARSGEYQTRRPLPWVIEGGFEVTERERLKLGTVERVAARRS
ncbi:class I SAM-dependent methyltransferase [Actinoplanes sp. CA-030573]|uniref:class I SAM-dependent methyltransferase n=1 Tax=Actinoplanes sp. CA-030573 TaxID=3239898 RepID=UPI003D8B0C0B